MWYLLNVLIQKTCMLILALCTGGTAEIAPTVVESCLHCCQDSEPDTWPNTDDSLDDSWRDALLLVFCSCRLPASPHSVGFAGACLSVCKYRGIVPRQAAIYQLGDTEVIYLLLQIT